MLFGAVSVTKWCCLERKCCNIVNFVLCSELLASKLLLFTTNGTLHCIVLIELRIHVMQWFRCITNTCFEECAALNYNAFLCIKLL